ncbi:TIGR01777 family oxidoreductase [Arcobacter sp. 15-2]|uniref:TIGR01777 family oxidoreductase n=1 Tax=Arcobacter sp. 15-2 TaxID=3374109 RepID=UPI00399C621C
MKKMIIVGASGFVGSQLTNTFTTKGYEVIATSRDDLHNISQLISKIDGADVVINLAGANIINRWSESYKKLLYSSRIDTTKALVKAFSLAKIKPKTFISTSAVGIYKNDDTYNEDTQNYANDFLGQLCQDWETEALKAKELGMRVSIFRFGIVLGDGGALAKMLTPFKLGIGGTIGDGSQSFSFIHIDDLINAYIFVIENELENGIFNLTAPQPTTNYGLTKALGKILNRPTILPIPQFVLNLLLSEGAKVLTDGQKAIPTHLINSGFTFKYENIEETIKDLV